MNSLGFCGSYRQGDVRFLLKPLSLQSFISVNEKERLIQSGNRHYSEMLSPETLPSENYLRFFQQAFDANRAQMAQDCVVLASLIHKQKTDGITLVSLARAGTPVGVILKHLLMNVFNRGCEHYSISIVRDRGIDEVALRHILSQGHAPESIVFVDGWTGKGVISKELTKCVVRFNQRHGVTINGGLYVLVDLAGTAYCAASCADYLIPSSILNATVSGLISRSILNDAIGPDDFHGCVYYDAFLPYDQSGIFAAALIDEGVALVKNRGIPVAEKIDREKAAAVCSAFMQASMKQYRIADPNLIKPGIGEATRVLLRRMPRLLILRNPHSADVSHLKVLAAEKGVKVVVAPELPYQAVSLIRSALDG